MKEREYRSKSERKGGLKLKVKKGRIEFKLKETEDRSYRERKGGWKSK